MSLESLTKFGELLLILYCIHTWFNRREFEADYYREKTLNLDKEFILSDIQNYKNGGICFLSALEQSMFADRNVVSKSGLYNSNSPAAERYYSIAEYGQKVALLAKIEPCKKCAGCERFYRKGTTISKQPFFGMNSSNKT